MPPVLQRGVRMNDDRGRAQFALLALTALLIAVFVIRQCGGAM
jgi:hypothetical protein